MPGAPQLRKTPRPLSQAETQSMKQIPAEIVFISSKQPAIDRGWDTQDVKIWLSENGTNCFEQEICSIDDIRELSTLHPSATFWPTGYTVGPDYHSPLLVSQFERLGLPFIGASSRSLQFSSKLKFKGEIDKQPGLNTPAYVPIFPGTRRNIPFGYPAVLKSEYSCNSEGVSRVENQKQLDTQIEEFSQRLSQALFVEKWERRTEFTVATICTAAGPECAAIELIPRENRKYIDSELKHDNALIEFRTPDEETEQRLHDIAHRIVRWLSLDGYFRIDIVQNDVGRLFPIEINFLPFLTLRQKQLSYFPMAYGFKGWDFGKMIAEIINAPQRQD